jgi:GTP1/Obg family GTP-binding protein
MELLTVATLEHLPTAALFVMDVTENCGCSCQQQWEIRTELLERFPHKLWIDVITKVDLLEEEIDAVDDLEASQPRRDVLPKDAVQMVSSTQLSALLQ